MSKYSDNSTSVLALFYSYAHEDEPLRDELEKHLSLLRRQGIISFWHDRQIIPGTDWSQDINQHLNDAAVILLLISPDFLASDYIFSVEMQQALARDEASEARVIPIILRPVDWTIFPGLARLQALPRDARPVTKWENRDEAFLDIAKGIRLVCKELHNNPLVSNSSTQRPSHTYNLWDVFLKSGVPQITFVEREDFGALKLSLAQPGRGVVIEGPSGIGKTTAVQKAVDYLKSKGYISSSDIQILNARNFAERGKIETLPAWHTGTVIVDDFHRLDLASSEKLVNHLKDLADKERSEKLVIIGIPQTHQRLVNLSFDLATRIDVFTLGLVNDELILQMIEKGEKALNIEFARKDEIVFAAAGSLNVAQFLCFSICQNMEIISTQDRKRLVHGDVDGAVSYVKKVLSTKFDESINYFAILGGPGDSTGLLLLEELARSENGFLSLTILKNKKPALARGIERFAEDQWMDKLYQTVHKANYFLYFDQALNALVIDDPQLLFYLKQLQFSNLARQIGKSPAFGSRKVFISYSHNDARWLQRLQVHLKPLEREGLVDLWDDTKIAAGTRWQESISEAIETARVAVILVSADFIASDFISNQELPWLLTRAASRGTRIIPVIVSPSAFEDTELGQFQAINTPGRPLSALSKGEQEQVLASLVKAIREIFNADEA
jgi:TIR domain